nr:WD40 repeat domain-containing protein [Anaerolineae bacterium]
MLRAYTLLTTTLLLWILGTFSSLMESAGTSYSFTQWSPNGSYIAQIVDLQFQLIDAANGQTFSLPQSLPTDINVFDWSPDGNRLAIGTDSGKIHIWQIENGTFSQVLAILDHGIGEAMGITGGVGYLDWSYTGAFLVSIGWTASETQIWDTSNYSRIFQAGTGDLSVVQWHPTDNLLAVWNGNDIRILDLNNASNFKSSLYTYSEFMTITQPIGQNLPELHIGTIAWKPDGTQLAIGSWFDGIWIIDTLTGIASFFTQVEQKDKRDFFGVRGLFWSKDGQFLYGATSDLGIINLPSFITIWDVNRKVVVEEFQTTIRVREFGVSPFGGRIVIGTAIPQGQSANTPFAGLQFIVPNPTDARLAELTQTCAQAESAVCDADLAAMQA